jgi:hypothetical protein
MIELRTSTVPESERKRELLLVDEHDLDTGNIGLSTVGIDDLS